MRHGQFAAFNQGHDESFEFPCQEVAMAPIGLARRYPQPTVPRRVRARHGAGTGRAFRIPTILHETLIVGQAIQLLPAIRGPSGTWPSTCRAPAMAVPHLLLWATRSVPNAKDHSQRSTTGAGPKVSRERKCAIPFSSPYVNHRAPRLRQRQWSTGGVANFCPGRASRPDHYKAAHSGRELGVTRRVARDEEEPDDLEKDQGTAD